jgi:hypothetical protein
MIRRAVLNGLNQVCCVPSWLCADQGGPINQEEPRREATLTRIRRSSTAGAASILSVPERSLSFSVGMPDDARVTVNWG